MPKGYELKINKSGTVEFTESEIKKDFKEDDTNYFFATTKKECIIKAISYYETEITKLYFEIIPLKANIEKLEHILETIGKEWQK